MGWAALVGECLFLAVAIGLRAWVQRRWTGTSGIVLFDQRRTTGERAASACFVVAVVGIAIGTAFRLGDDDATSAAQALGVGLVAVGIALTTWAQFAMGEAWRIGVDREVRTDLVTGGPFRFVRNPIYTGMAAFAAGIALMLGNLPSLVGFLGMVAGVEVQVRLVEEPFLRDQHDHSFLSWARSAGRFLPGIGRLRAS